MVRPSLPLASRLNRWLAPDSIAATGLVTACVLCFATVRAGQPGILEQPLDKTAVLGTRATLSVTATGSPPPSFQWSFNGTNWPADAPSAYPRPPLIWSSFALYPSTVSEANLMAQARQIKSAGFLDLGWDTIEIDDSWAGSRNSNGDLVANAARFPHGLGWVVANLHGLGFRVLLYLTMGKSSPEGMPGCESHWAHDALYFAKLGVNGFKIADDNHALDPVRIEYSFRQFISALGTRAGDFLIQGSYHTPQLPGPWFSQALNGHYLVGKHPDGTDTADNLVMTPNNAGFTNLYSILDTSLLPFSWLIRPGHYFCGYGLAGGGPKYAYQAQMALCALFCVGATAYSFRTDNSEQGRCQRNRVLLGLIRDPAVIPGRVVSRNKGAGEVYARPLSVPGQFAVGLINRDPSRRLTGAFNATDLGLAPNSSLTLFEVFSNQTFTAQSGTVSVKLDPHQVRLFVVGTNANGRLALPPYADPAPPDIVTSSVVLPSVQLAQGGVYQVRVFNTSGSVISSNALLTVSEATVGLPAVTLNIEASSQGVVLKWPAWARDLVLQEAMGFLGKDAAWVPVSTTVQITNDEAMVNLPPTGAARFFRLANP
jgi:hypothetical protein